MAAEHPAEHPTLPPIVDTVLRGVEEARLRVGLQAVLALAWRTSLRLRDLDLAGLEARPPGAPGADLALWEQAAPAAAESVAAVSGLVEAVDEQFAGGRGRSADGPSDEAPEHAGGDVPDVPVTPEQRREAAVDALRTIATGLRMEVARFGERMREPGVVADRWNLLLGLQEFRGRCRAAIGEMVFAACSAFADVERPDVVPEYARDLAEALAVRQSIATLARAVWPLNARMKTAADGQQRPLLLAVRRELSLFEATTGYRWMRIGDKRLVVAFSRELDEVLSSRRAGRDVQRMVEGFSTLLDSLGIVSRREILRGHDRAALAECGTLLEQASTHLEAGDGEAARGRLAAAGEVAARLFGRDRGVDDWVATRLRWPVRLLAEDAVAGSVEDLRHAVAEAGSQSAP